MSDGQEQEHDTVKVINVYREDLGKTKFQIDPSRKTLLIITDKEDEVSE
jgi:hypothetical protein